ncbi:hypothetical protein OGAPHI_006967 [Ogataea philodendri]|uniref:Periodic tryptophan protein 1 n=1 Tax=Ogataea philodendri TaxID=1378263 RepID=A0A9P8T0A0_9ASCO|nr:uncharacterized protein OGAPHI_006967 [Ogataea philodendri]KAH3660381.1 hypothetical protein OGAPHI_006967 [Ogataea philodendri]
MISASSWVPRGYASEFPEKYELNDEEMARIEEMANLQIAEAQEDLDEVENTDSNAVRSQLEIDDDLKEYDFDHYDDEPVDEVTGEPVSMFPGLSNTAASYIKVENDDEEMGEDGPDEHYITLPTDREVAEEKAELQVYPTDNMVLATRTEDDVSYLDVYIYDDGAGAPAGADEEEEDKLDADIANGMIRENNLYIHHDLMLPSFPLCVEWMSFKPYGANDETNVANFAAIGTFEPQIEIWNLDSIDKAFPDAILGEVESQTKKSKKKSKKRVNAHRHTDAVLSLAHNQLYRNVLASSSADGTVKLWDLTSCQVARSLDSLHGGKHVSSSQWLDEVTDSSNGSILLTGGYDSACCVNDVRVAEEKSVSRRYNIGTGEEVECVRWSSDSTRFFAGTDVGNVYCFDAKMESKPLWTLHAHDSGISTLEANKFINNMLVTGAMGEQTVKLWKLDSQQNQASGPSMVLSRDFDCGKVLTTSFARDIEVAGNLVIGGSGSTLKMWDSFSNRSVRTAFKPQLAALQKRAREEAKNAGRASRIARKYTDKYSESVMEAERGEDDDEDDQDDE